jgi:hypothetical protein
MSIVFRWLPPSLGSRQSPETIAYSQTVYLMIHQIHTFRIKHHLELTQIVKGLVEVVKQIPTLFRLHYYIINVGFDVPPDLTF